MTLYLQMKLLIKSHSTIWKYIEIYYPYCLLNRKVHLIFNELNNGFFNKNLKKKKRNGKKKRGDKYGKYVKIKTFK